MNGDRHLSAVPTDPSDPAYIRPIVREQPAEPELRAFLQILYRALKMITSFLEKNYGF